MVVAVVADVLPPEPVSDEAREEAAARLAFFQDSAEKATPKPKPRPKTDVVTLLYGTVDRDWQTRSNCLGVDPDLFFPERGASTREAKEVCRGCVVREDCLEFALTNGEKFGIWGGLSERERRRIRRKRAIEKKTAEAAQAVKPSRQVSEGESIRCKIATWLKAQDGEFSDSRGYVASVIAAQIGSPSLSVSRMLALMAKDGELIRETTKTRTYKATLTAKGQALPLAQIDTPEPTETPKASNKSSKRGGRTDLSLVPKTTRDERDEDVEEDLLVQASLVVHSTIHGFTRFINGDCGCPQCSQAYQDWLDAPRRKEAIAFINGLMVFAQVPPVTSIARISASARTRPAKQPRRQQEAVVVATVVSPPPEAVREVKVTQLAQTSESKPALALVAPPRAPESPPPEATKISRPRARARSQPRDRAPVPIVADSPNATPDNRILALLAAYGGMWQDRKRGRVVQQIARELHLKPAVVFQSLDRLFHTGFIGWEMDSPGYISTVRLVRPKTAKRAASSRPASIARRAAG